jgi:hypothetical protein
VKPGRTSKKTDINGTSAGNADMSCNSAMRAARSSLGRS